MTTYHFDRLKKNESAFYFMKEESEAVFRSAVANWVKRHRAAGESVIISCERVTERIITGEKMFLGMRITKDY